MTRYNVSLRTVRGWKVIGRDLDRAAAEQLARQSLAGRSFHQTETIFWDISRLPPVSLVKLVPVLAPAEPG